MPKSAIELPPSHRLVASALAEVEESTVVALAAAAGVGKSTVAKALTLLEQAGAACRTVRETRGIREADLWSPTAGLGALLFADSSNSTGHGHAQSPSSSPGAAETTSDGALALAETPTNISAIAETETSPLVREGGPASPQLRDGDSGRLAPGGLVELVRAALSEHPDIEYTPTMLSHLLKGRSAGAIHNALEKMVAAGTAMRTCDRPKRYRSAAQMTSAEG